MKHVSTSRPLAARRFGTYLQPSWPSPKSEASPVCVRVGVSRFLAESCRRGLERTHWCAAPGSRPTLRRRPTDAPASICSGPPRPALWDFRVRTGRTCLTAGAPHRTRASRRIALAAAMVLAQTSAHLAAMHTPTSLLDFTRRTENCRRPRSLSPALRPGIHPRWFIARDMNFAVRLSGDHYAAASGAPAYLSTHIRRRVPARLDTAPCSTFCTARTRPIVLEFDKGNHRCGGRRRSIGVDRCAIALYWRGHCFFDGVG